MVSNWTRKAAAVAAMVLLASCGGGGGGGTGVTAVPGTVPEAVLASVTDAQVLEGAAGTTELVFTVTLDKESVSGNRVTWSTASTAKSGGGGTGSATGGAACGAGVDYVNVPLTTLLIPRGARTGELRVTVCGDAAFEPTETLAVNWSTVEDSVNRTGTQTGTIVNDDAGGLNGTGVASAFGRDSNALTNSGTDGRLGFSFANVAGAPAACVRDNVTGLLWEGKTAGNAGDTFTYAALAARVAAVNGASLCGFNDWRLPTPEELLSVVDLGTTAAPLVDTAWFTNQAAAGYWSATTRQLLATDAWYVDYAGGVATFDDKATAKRARLVSRGGTTEPAPLPATCNDATRFSVHGDGTVTDKRTGLMWKQCLEGQSGGTCTGGAAGAYTYTGALSRMLAANADATGLGYSDWRIPTRAELSSITEREQCKNPAINATAFPNSPTSSVWTSTPAAFDNSLAWSVDFAEGEFGLSQKATQTLRLRLVRAGQ